MLHNTDDLRIVEINELLPPIALTECIPLTESSAKTVYQARNAIHNLLHGDDDRLLVIVGPCSIHDIDAALEYAGKISEARQKYGDHLEIVMRVYFEKPRTTVGWKGLINDPYLDNSFRLNQGLRLARKPLSSVKQNPPVRQASLRSCLSRHSFSDGGSRTTRRCALPPPVLSLPLPLIPVILR